MVRIFFAPGRVNLIGEHLDYNGGVVMPAALTIGITAKFEKRGGDKLLLQSTTHRFKKEIGINEEINFESGNDWTNYPLGIIKYLKKEGYRITPGEITFESTLPEASGLSSSAALEVLTAYMLLEQAGWKRDMRWLAMFCRQVENEFIGVKCGIMDQFSVASGKAGNAMLLDCSSVACEYVPLQLGDFRLLILDTRKPRSLVHSKYNERKEECEAALKIIQNSVPISNLASAKPEHLDLLNDSTLRRRVKHVITEVMRVDEAAMVLRRNIVTAFGALMNFSHDSLKNDYEVSGFELDTLVESARRITGCVGARMTGAGFGGCAIALVYKDFIEELINVVSEKYRASTGLNCEIYESQIGDGVREI